MYKFFMSLKQPDGSFVVSRNAEVDIRGIYCLLVVATLLDMLTPELIAGVPHLSPPSKPTKAVSPRPLSPFSISRET
jgi:hypothetical protein